MDFNKVIFQIAAEMLRTSPGLLDYRLVEYLEELDNLVRITNGQVVSRQVVALAILAWRHSVCEDFTEKPPTGIGNEKL